MGLAQNEATGSFGKQFPIETRIKNLDSIIFQVRYESHEFTDSIKTAIFGNNKKNDAFSFYYESEIEKAHSNYRLALVHLDTASYFAQNPYFSAIIYKKKGQVYTILDDLTLALENFHKALKIANADENLLLKAEIYAALGEFHRKTDEFDKAVQCLDSALYFINESTIDSSLLISVYDRYAAILNQTGEIVQAMDYSFKALQLAELIDDKHAQGVSHNEIGYAYEHLQKTDSAEYHYNKAIDFWTEINALRYLANAKFNLSRLYLIENRFYDAKDLLFEIEESTKNKGWYEVYPMLYDKISLIYAAESDSLNFYKYDALSKDAWLTMLNEENKKKMVELAFQYEQDANLEIIKNQKSELKLRGSNLQLKEAQTYQLVWYLISAFILLVFSLIMLKRTRNAKKRTSEINSDLKESIKEKDALLREVHHRVKNNFQMIYSLMTLRAIGLEDQKAVAVLDETQSRIHAMALVHEQLYKGTDLNHIDLNKFLLDIVGSLAHSELNSQEFIDIEGCEINLHIEQAIPVGIIIHELATNSFKYAWRPTDDKKIKISVNNDDGNLCLIYADNGKGLPRSFKIKNSKTFGLRLVDLFVHKQLKGSIEYANIKPGSQFKLLFKLRT